MAEALLTAIMRRLRERAQLSSRRSAQNTAKKICLPDLKDLHEQLNGQICEAAQARREQEEE